MTYELPSLANKAMLVRLTRGVWQPYAFDRVATEVVEQTTTVSKAGRFNKHLLKDSVTLKATNAASYAVYDYHMRHTLPWLDNGARILPSSMYFDYTQGIRERMAEADKAAAQLQAAWPSLLVADKDRLGALFNPDDYPRNIKERYYNTVKFLPIPTVADFRVDISDEDKQSLEDAIHEAEAGVARDLLERLLDPVQKFVEKMSVPIGEQGAVFRDTMVGNIVELVQALPRLNVTEDARIVKLTKAIEAVIKPFAANPAVLRESQEVREQARDRMKTIMDKMGAWMGDGQ